MGKEGRVCPGVKAALLPFFVFVFLVLFPFQQVLAMKPCEIPQFSLVWDRSCTRMPDSAADTSLNPSGARK